MLNNIKTYNPLSGYHKAIKKLENNGLRPTKQRMILAKLLFEKGKRHISAENLYIEVKFVRGFENHGFNFRNFRYYIKCFKNGNFARV